MKYFTSQLFCLNILRVKAVNEIAARQTRTSSCKHDFIRVCSIEYLTTQIELILMLPTFKSWTVHRIMEYLALGLLSSLRNIYHNTKVYFFDPPCVCNNPENWVKIGPAPL